MDKLILRFRIPITIITGCLSITTLANQLGQKAGGAAGRAAAEALKAYQTQLHEQQLWSKILLGLGILLSYLTVRTLFSEFFSFHERTILRWLGIRRGVDLYETAEESVLPQRSQPIQQNLETTGVTEKTSVKISNRIQLSTEELVASWNGNCSELLEFLECKPWLLQEVLTGLRPGSQQLDFTLWMLSRQDKAARAQIQELVQLPPFAPAETQWDLANSRVHFDFFISQLRLAERKEMRTWSSVIDTKDLQALLSLSSDSLVLGFAKMESLQGFLVFSRCCPIERLQSICKSLGAVRKLKEAQKLEISMKTSRGTLASLAVFLRKPQPASAP